MKRTNDKVLIEALRILSRDIQSGDGVANAAIAEGALRLEELVAALEYIAHSGLARRHLENYAYSVLDRVNANNVTLPKG